MKRLICLPLTVLILLGNITHAQQKPKPKPVVVDVPSYAQKVLTQKIRNERKNQALAVTLDTTAPYPVAANAKGVRGTGTILTPKTGKQEMFAYDVQVSLRNPITSRVSYKLMKGVVTTSDNSAMEYRMKMAQSVIRSKIQHDKGKTMIVTFKSAIPVPVTAQTTQINGEGGFSDGKTSTKFQYTTTIDAANGRVRGARYEITPDQKVKR